MSTLPSAAIPARSPIDFTRPMFCLFGVAFDLLAMNRVVGVLSDAIRERRRVVLSTPNVNHVVAVQLDAGFRDSVTASDLVVADGMPIVWLARMLGIPAARIAGSNVFEQLQKGEAGRLNVFFFGGPEGVADQARRRLISRSGPLSSTGGLYPGFGSVADMASPEVAAEINEARPDFLVVALGSTKGQAWIDQIKNQVTAPIISHLGAVVNFTAGTVRRAPPLVQITGGEWLWRISEEPTLWRRYANDARVLLRMIVSSVIPLMLRRIGNLLRAPSAAPAADLQIHGNGTHLLRLSGEWRAKDTQRFGEILNTLTAEQGNIEIDASALGRVDQRIIACLIRLRGMQLSSGYRLSIRAPSAEFVRTLRLHCASYLIADSARSASGAGFKLMGTAK